MQRKIPNINFRDKLHSIPISKVKNVKSNVLYSIPSVVALLLMAVCSLVSGKSCFAADSTASLAIGQESLSTTAAQGTVAYLSSTITASSTGEMESYTLSITGPVGLEGGTTITGANNNTPANMADNTWGYAYNDSNSNENKTYKSFTGSAQTLESGTTPSGVAKNITFAAKFGENAEAGHYTGKVQVNLTTTPKAVTGAEWTLPDGTKVASGIEYMQDITTGTGTNSFCSQVDTPAASSEVGQTKVPTIQLIDRRDQSEYTIAKLPDGKCWMTQNLRLRLTTGGLSSSDTDISSDWNSSSALKPTKTYTSLVKTNFSKDAGNYYAVESYIANPLSESTSTGYYSWSAATAGTGTSSITSGPAPGSICPKGWRLPSGGSMNGTVADENQGEFQQLVNIIKGNFGNYSDTVYGIMRGAPYNFTNTGYVNNGVIIYNIMASSANWWSRTAKDSTYAYDFDLSYIDAAYIVPTNSEERYRGEPIRCIAR